MALSGVTHLVFDIDDTLYPSTNGFTKHRNYDVACEYMVSNLGFKSLADARAFRDREFEKYHATVKLLKVASDEGRLPPNEDGSARKFHEADLAEHWVKCCHFEKYIEKNEVSSMSSVATATSPLRSLLLSCRLCFALATQKLEEALDMLSKNQGLKLVVFTNAPRAYGIRVLEHLRVAHFFDPENIFGVDDLMPLCKPQPAAFEAVLSSVGCESAQKAVMFEDSMKNIRAAKSVGMKTVLVNPKHGSHDVGDAPDEADDAVDITLESISQMQEKLPALFEANPTFVTT